MTELREIVARALCRRGGTGLCVGFCHTERCVQAVRDYGDDADAAIVAMWPVMREMCAGVVQAHYDKAPWHKMGDQFSASIAAIRNLEPPK